MGSVPLAIRPKHKKGSPGNDLLYQGPASQVPSALEGLTTWFGMEQGVSPPLELPEKPFMPFSRGLALSKLNRMIGVHADSRLMN